jgi:hypothetical protein
LGAPQVRLPAAFLLTDAANPVRHPGGREKDTVSVFAIITWSITLSFGLFLLAIWLIEYDSTLGRADATRLPVPVLSAHALLAISGVPVWLVYIVTATRRLAWAAVILLASAAVLGLIMAARWIRVYRAYRSAAATVTTAPAATLSSWRALTTAPAERNFPVTAVIGHGVFGVATVVLVLLTALRIG